MEKVPQNIDDLLLDYLDDKLSAAEKATLQTLAGSNDVVRKRLAELRLIHQYLNGQRLEEPTRNFTWSVMNRLDESPARNGLSMKNGVLLLIGIIAAMGIGAWLLTAGVFDQSQTMLDLNKIPLSQQYIRHNLPSIPIDGKLVVNIIIILNLALALVVFDRVILKPFFQRRIQGTR